MNKPCPLCQSTDLSKNTWHLETGEVDALECNQCYCGAPKKEWNKERNEKGDNDEAKI